MNPDLRNYVLSASILFLHAKLENYISDIFLGIAQEVAAHISSADEVPAALVGWIFLADGHLERSRQFVARNDEYAFISTTGAYIAAELMSDPSGYFQLARFDGIDSKKYPSVKNVKRMFKRVGIENIFFLLQKRLRRNVEVDLRSFNSMRGQLAHSGVSGQLSYADVRRFMLDVQRMVVAMDKELFYHLRAACNEKVWKE